MHSQPTGSTASASNAIERVGDERISNPPDASKAVAAALLTAEDFATLLNKEGFKGMFQLPMILRRKMASHGDP